MKKIKERSLFFTMELSPKFDFGHQMPKPDIFGHWTISKAH
jgi:hypothetical protein